MNRDARAVWRLDLNQIGLINSELFGQIMRLHGMARATGTRLVVRTAADSEVMRLLRWFKVAGRLEIEHD